MIEVFADVSCPFTHVGLRRLIDRRTELGRVERLHVKAWPLELVNGQPPTASSVAEKILELRKEVAPHLFERFDPTTFPTTTLPALRLVVAAYRVDALHGEQVSLALRYALFEEGRDIAAPEVLADVARVHDLVPGPLDDETVIAEWHEGERRGVEGSPYFFAQGKGFFCPSLDIRHIGDQLHVETDDEELERFVAVAFG